MNSSFQLTIIKDHISIQRILLAFVLTFFVLSSGHSQNLVPDPGFEDWNGTIGANPNTLGGLNLWYEVNGTPDHHHQLNPPGSNLTSLQNCPLGNGQNQCGEPKEGQATLGSYKANGNTGTKEWAAIELDQPLTPGVCYDVAFWIQNKKDNPSFIMETNQWGVFFSNDPAPAFDPNTIDFNTVTNQWVNSDVLVNDTIWHYLQMTFPADDAYPYIFVGYVGNPADATTNAWSMSGSVGFYVWIDSVSVTPATVPFITASNDVAICEGDSVLIFADSNLPVTWNNGVVGDSIWVTPIATTTYDPTGGLGQFCEVIDQVTVTVNPCNCPVPITVVPSGTNNTLCNSNLACDGTATATALTGVAPFTFQWDDPTMQVSQTAIGLCPGIYSCVVNDSDGCEETVMYEISGLEDASITLTPDPESCAGLADGGVTVTINSGVQPFTYDWSNSDITQDLSNVSTGIYDLILTDANGCDYNYSTFVDLVEGSLIELNYPENLCVDNSPLQLDLTLADGIWTGPGITDITTGMFDPSLVGTGIYVLNYEPNAGCGTTYEMTVVVVALPNADFFVDVTLGCAPLTVEFTPANLNVGSDYYWDFGDGTNSNDVIAQNQYFIEGIYDVSLDVIDANGCFATFSQPELIDVIGQPIADFTFSPGVLNDINNEVIFTDTSTGATSWVWDLGNGAISHEQNPYAQYSSSGIYEVTLTIESGDNCTSTISYNIVYDNQVFIYVPNSFSPNQDGLNDYFQVISTSDLGNYELLVYDRWGSVVFGSKDINDQWDGGHYLGEPYYLNESIYTYEIVYTTNDLESERIFGSLYLMR